MKFKVWVTFITNNNDYFDNNGNGFSAEEVLQVAKEFKEKDDVKKVEIEETDSKTFYTINQYEKLRG